MYFGCKLGTAGTFSELAFVACLLGFHYARSILTDDAKPRLVKGVIFQNWVEAAYTANTKRNQVVEISVDTVVRNPSHLKIDIFGSHLNSKRLRFVSMNDYLVWQGKLDGYNHSLVSLTVRHSSLYGSVTFHDGTGSHNFEIRATRLLQRSREHRYLVSDKIIREKSGQIVLPDLFTKPPSHAQKTSASSSANEDSGDVITLLALYTPAASKHHGKHELEKMIIAAVERTNLVYQNSNVSMYLQLVGLEMVEYQENGNMSKSLTHLQDPSDGVMDNVQGLRNQYGADQVTLITQDTSACGIAYVMPNLNTDFTTWAYSIVHDDSFFYCLGEYTLAHELGHNQGNHHDVADAGKSSIFPYSHGFQYCEEGGFRTVMSYSCNDMDVPRVPYFSNPHLSHNGVAMGNEATANCAESMKQTKRTVANWNRAPNESPTRPTDFSVHDSGQDYVSLRWGKSRQADGYLLDRRTQFTDWLNLATVSASVSTYNDTSLTNGLKYYYRLRAFNSADATSSNNIIMIDFSGFNTSHSQRIDAVSPSMTSTPMMKRLVRNAVRRGFDRPRSSRKINCNNHMYQEKP